MRITFDNPILAGNAPHPYSTGFGGAVPNDCAWCLLGALGDICILLPLFYKLHQETGKKQQVVVSANYAPMFDGVSYVETLIYPEKYDRNDKRMVQKIVDFAKSKFQSKPLVFLNPIECPDGKPPQATDSFVKEFWRIAGRPDEWSAHPLIFDQRDEQREAALLERICPDIDKPVILAALTGLTSPFPHAADLLKSLQERFPDCQVVDLATVKAERPYDLLGLFDEARLLVSVDTMHLHLSRASGVPVIALARDYPTNWNGSPWNKRFQFYCRYSQYPTRKEELLRAAQDVFDSIPRVWTRPVMGLAIANGYNLSIIRHDEKLLGSYRYHPNQHWATKLRMVELDKEFKAVKDFNITFPSHMQNASLEDMRLFHFRDKLWGSYTVTHPRVNAFPTCVIGYSELLFNGEQWLVGKHLQPKYGNNDHTGLCKNWVPIPHGSRLYFIYSQHPEQVVIEVEDEQVINEYRSPVPPWAWGEIRGGTTPIPFKGVMLRFFHSCFHHTKERSGWQYHIGCCACSPEPPFEMLAISSHPILSGHEWKNPTAHHQKSGVAIVYGAINDGDEAIIISTGINDSCCAVSRLTERQLRLA